MSRYSRRGTEYGELMVYSLRTCFEIAASAASTANDLDSAAATSKLTRKYYFCKSMHLREVRFILFSDDYRVYFYVQQAQ